MMVVIQQSSSLSTGKGAFLIYSRVLNKEETIKVIAIVEMIKVIAIVLGTTKHNQYCSEHHENIATSQFESITEKKFLWH